MFGNRTESLRQGIMSGSALRISTDKGILGFPSKLIGWKTCQRQISVAGMITLSSGRWWNPYFHLRRENLEFPPCISIRAKHGSVHFHLLFPPVRVTLVRETRTCHYNELGFRIVSTMQKVRDPIDLWNQFFLIIFSISLYFSLLDSLNSFS